MLKAREYVLKGWKFS